MSWGHARYLEWDFAPRGSSGGGGSQQVSNQTELPAWVTQAAQANLAQANQVASQPYQPYTGQTVAGLTPDQQAAYGYVRNNMGQATNAVNAAASGITGQNLVGTAQSLLNPYLQQVEQTGVAQINQDAAQQQRALAGQAAQAGAFGGTRFGVEAGTLGAQTAMKTGQFVANTQAQGWDTAVNTAMQQAQQVAQLAGQGQTLGLQGASALSTAGQQQQNQQQAQYDAAMQQWQTAQNYPLQQLAINESALTSTPYGGTSTSTQPIRGGNPMMGALGGAATGAALGTAVMPGIGTGVGAAGGALLGYLGSR